MQSYETDVIAWANEQAAFIRSGLPRGTGFTPSRPKRLMLLSS